jgi:hypothetical protein
VPAPSTGPVLLLPGEVPATDTTRQQGRVTRRHITNQGLPINPAITEVRAAAAAVPISRHHRAVQPIRGHPAVPTTGCHLPGQVAVTGHREAGLQDPATGHPHQADLQDPATGHPHQAGLPVPASVLPGAAGLPVASAALPAVAAVHPAAGPRAGADSQQSLTNIK